MLVLSRKPKESLSIGPDITITVLGVHGNKVSLGIETPDSLAVWRTEALMRKVLTDVEQKSTR